MYLIKYDAFLEIRLVGKCYTIYRTDEIVKHILMWAFAIMFVIVVLLRGMTNKEKKQILNMQGVLKNPKLLK